MRCGRFGMEQRITSEQVRFFMKVSSFVTLYVHSNSNMPTSLNIFTWPQGHPLCHLPLLLPEGQKAGAFFHSSYFVRSCHVRTRGTAVPLCKSMTAHTHTWNTHRLCIFCFFFSHALSVSMCGRCRFGNCGNSNFGWCPVAKLGHENMRLLGNRPSTTRIVKYTETIFDSC